MADRKNNSRVLRQLAAGLSHGLAAEGIVLEAERDDFVTSIVRQWITNDGIAAWFVAEDQLYFTHRHTPLGKPLLTTERVQPGWFAALRRDWHIDSEELSDIIGQLNRGQSAEATNMEGVPLRLWVNPKERTVGVEKLVTEPTLPGTKRDYRIIALEALPPLLGMAVEKEELEALARSVAKQWQEYHGHACIFLDRGEQLVLTLHERGDGSCQVVTAKRDVDLTPLLSSLGFPPAALPDVMAHINLGQVIEFRDKEGVPSILWHDPKERRVRVRPRDHGFAKGKFKLGTIEIEPRASMVLARSGQDAHCFLQRHLAGDWGEGSDKMKEEYDRRLKKGEAVTSCFVTTLGERILVSTTADRQRTVVSAPDPEIVRDMLRIASGS
ncbi:MAG: hypothetical protein U0793_17915 [Gemmataceae bacterium]